MEPRERVLKKHISLDSSRFHPVKPLQINTSRVEGKFPTVKRDSLLNRIFKKKASPRSANRLPTLNNSSFLSSNSSMNESSMSPTIPSVSKSFQEGSSPLKKRPFEKKEKLQCFFCGGKGCKHENWENNPNSIIKGLDSDWITEDLLAMQRPSSRLIREYDVIKQFKELNIQTVINVQEPGEHPYCGDGIRPESGFSYLPEEFSDNGIYFYNFGWRDLTATDFSHMIRIMDILRFSLQNGQKVAVHCHAGRGRTLLVIGSWMIYQQKISAKDVITHCSERREGVLSKASQRKFLHDFEQYLINRRKIFHVIPAQDLQELLKMQKVLINSEVARLVRFYPLLLHEVERKIKNMLIMKICSSYSVLKGFLNVDENIFASPWGRSHEEDLKQTKSWINRMDYDILENIKDPRIICQLILDLFENLALPSINYDVLFRLEDLLDEEHGFSLLEENVIFDILPKTDFYLLLKFGSILKLINEFDKTTSQFNSCFGKRIAVSILLLRKKYVSSFNGRSFNAEDIDSEHVTCISELIILFSKKSSKELEQNYRSRVNLIMNKAPPLPIRLDSEESNSSISSPRKLSRFAKLTLKKVSTKTPSSFANSVINSSSRK